MNLARLASMSKVHLSALLTAGMLVLPAFSDDDPAGEVIAEMLREREAQAKALKAPVASEPAKDPVAKPVPPPVAKPAPKEVEPAPPARLGAGAAQVIEDILNSNRQRQERGRRDALVLYEQAQAAQSAGRLADAHRLARKAARLFPGHDEITKYVVALERDFSDKRINQPTFSKAKAHLAAAVTRGKNLLAAGRYTEAEDLLKGVVHAAALFPEGARVDMYTRLAQEELDQYQLDVEAGRIVPDSATTTSSKPETNLVATGAAAPTNMRRILRGSESKVPLWYAMQKNRLAATMAVDYRQRTMALVLDDISKQTGAKFVIDRPIAATRGHLNTTVDLRVAGVSGETILDLVCRKSGYEYVMMERSIVITTPSRAVTYVKSLPSVLQQNWAAARVLFPESNPELFATMPAGNAGTTEVAALDQNVPAYLVSGRALIDDIQQLLR